MGPVCLLKLAGAQGSVTSGGTEVLRLPRANKFQFTRIAEVFNEMAEGDKY